jgi:hypothetical protein
MCTHSKKFGGRWSWIFSFTRRQLYPRRKLHRYPLNRRLGGTLWRREKYSFPSQELNPGRQVHSPICYTDWVITYYYYYYYYYCWRYSTHWIYICCTAWDAPSPTNPCRFPVPAELCDIRLWMKRTVSKCGGQLWICWLKSLKQPTRGDHTAGELGGASSLSPYFGYWLCCST